MKIEIDLSDKTIAAISALTAAVSALTASTVSLVEVDDEIQPKGGQNAVSESNEQKEIKKVQPAKSKTPPKEKPHHETAPRPQSQDVKNGPSVTFEHLRATLIAAAGPRGEHRAKVQELITSFGFETLPEIPEESWGDLAAKAQRLAGG